MSAEDNTYTLKREAFCQQINFNNISNNNIILILNI